LTGRFRRANEKNYRKICHSSGESGNCCGEKDGKNGGARGGSENEAVIWKKTGHGRSAVNVASWGVLSIDVGFSLRVWTHETRQFTLTIPIWIEFNSFAQLRSIGHQGKSGKGYRCMGMRSTQRLCMSALGQIAAMEEDEEREAWKGISSIRG
jgi:hypothetical protein